MPIWLCSANEISSGKAQIAAILSVTTGKNQMSIVAVLALAGMQ